MSHDPAWAKSDVVSRNPLLPAKLPISGLALFLSDATQKREGELWVKEKKMEKEK